MNLLKQGLIAGIRVYQYLIAPAKHALFGPLGQCRFKPSCSHYAIQALEIHGIRRGLWLALRRLLRCHPWGGCGDDPVPDLDRTSARPATNGFLDQIHPTGRAWSGWPRRTS